MKSYHINLGAGLAGLTLKEHPEPQCERHEVLVRVRAVSLNYRDASAEKPSAKSSSILRD